ncbi:MAG: hypothetical protein LUD46_15410 [Parabacteroides sp.]|nr:hypothetical protein [Parabacteroides sp.]
MTFIANPIYDVVLKYLMEDERVAKILLSALLKKEILELEMRKQEYTAMQQNRISLFRMDFSAKIRDNDGSEHLVLIELQKTWLATETLRFRQYLGTQYLNKENMRSDNDSNYGLPIISIYILGHILGDLKEPVIYVRRRYLDYDDNEIDRKDKFIESLTHDSIIVQIPYLQGRTRNRLERLLNLFDQDRRRKDNDHYLEIDETQFHDKDEKLLVDRLLRAGTTPDVRRAMEVEDEILSEIEARDTTIMLKDKELEQKEQMIEQKEQVIEQNKIQLEQQQQALKEMVRLLSQAGISIEDIAHKLSLSPEDINKITE